MSVYNMTFTASSNPTDTLVGINTAAGGVLGVGISLVLYFILIKASNDEGYSIGSTLLFSSFILSVISGILLAIGILPDYVLGINITVLVASILIKIFGGK